MKPDWSYERQALLLIRQAVSMGISMGISTEISMEISLKASTGSQTSSQIKNPARLYDACQKIYRSRFPHGAGQTGVVLGALTEWMAGYRNGFDSNESQTMIMQYFLQDISRIYSLLADHPDWDDSTWRKFLPRLEAHQDSYFKTPSGAAFIRLLGQKLAADGQKQERPPQIHPQTGGADAVSLSGSKNRHATQPQEAGKREKESRTPADKCMADRETEQLEQTATWLTSETDTGGKQTPADSVTVRRETGRTGQAGTAGQTVYRQVQESEEDDEEDYKEEDKEIERKELERIARWLTSGREEAPAGRKYRISAAISVCRRAAVPLLVCLALCAAAVWLRGEIVRRSSEWHIRRLRTEAAQQPQPADPPDVRLSGADGRERTEENTDTSGISGTGSYTDTAAGPEAQNDIKRQAGQRQKDEDPALDETTADDPGNRRRQAGMQKKQPRILPEYQQLAQQYQGLYGWLAIPGTGLDLPVMQPPEDDMEFYLDHDFTGAPSPEGALFVDGQNSGFPQDDNTVVYGHNMKNGHIFGLLVKYQEADYCMEHRNIQFDTLYETGEYEVVAVLKTRIRNENEEGFRYYQFFNYQDRESFGQCRAFVEENRLYDTGISLRYGDRILMLSTCEYSQENGRLVVVARKI